MPPDEILSYAGISCKTNSGAAPRTAADAPVGLFGGRLRDLCDAPVFFYFPFSCEGWAKKIHPVVVEQPTKLID
jgi:hypothetical protein